MMKPMVHHGQQQATRITTAEGVKAAADTLLKMYSGIKRAPS
jgi:hypothetical protein